MKHRPELRSAESRSMEHGQGSAGPLPCLIPPPPPILGGVRLPTAEVRLPDTPPPDSRRRGPAYGRGEASKADDRRVRRLAGHPPPPPDPRRRMPTYGRGAAYYSSG